METLNPSRYQATFPSDSIVKSRVTRTSFIFASQRGWGVFLGWSIKSLGLLTIVCASHILSVIQFACLPRLILLFAFLWFVKRRHIERNSLIGGQMQLSRKTESELLFKMIFNRFNGLGKPTLQARRDIIGVMGWEESKKKKIETRSWINIWKPGREITLEGKQNRIKVTWEETRTREKKLLF